MLLDDTCSSSSKILQVFSINAVCDWDHFKVEAFSQNCMIREWGNPRMFVFYLSL